MLQQEVKVVIMNEKLLTDSILNGRPKSNITNFKLSLTFYKKTSVKFLKHQSNYLDVSMLTDTHEQHVFLGPENE